MGRSLDDENIDSVRKLLLDTQKLMSACSPTQDSNSGSATGKSKAEIDGTSLGYTKVTGSEAGVKTYRANPGDLQFFMGRYCLHKISKVHGDLARLVAIFALSDEKEFWNPVSRSILNCGRAYPQHYDREARIQRDHL